MADFNIQITNEQQVLDIDDDQLRNTAAHVLQAMNIFTAEISIAVVDNGTIRQLKAQWFDMDVVTDVISFDLGDEQTNDETDGDNEKMDCEVVINAELALELAGSPEKALGELNLYLVHGLLHQLGFDDQSDQQAIEMHNKEDQLLDELGFGKVYSRKG